MSEAALHVSHLYFKRRLTKQDIAALLGISRFKVARLIDQALEEGLVRIEVHEPVPLAEELGRQLEHALGLELALVVRPPAGTESVEAIARVAASWLPELIRPDDVLGVAWGSTIQRVARALPQAPSVPVVQICGAVAGVESGEGPHELAWQFAERLGGSFYPLPVPALVASPAAREDVPPGAAGDLLVHVFDADGGLIETPLTERAIQLSVEQLRRARVLAVAGGPGKARAIRGALRTGLIDVVVTDEANAEAAL
jgi:DNA-binding transcriptional regulator LsrR (DeoR family)